VTTQQRGQRPKWANYNTWDHTRRRSKSAHRKARRQLAELINNIPATLAAAQNRSDTMTDYWSEEDMEARQEARRATLSRSAERAQSPTGRWFTQAAMAWMEGREAPPTPPRTAAERGPLTEREQQLADGLIFSDHEDRQAAAAAEHRALRRIAEQEVTQRERLHNTLRDAHGLDYADEWLEGA